LSFSFNPEAGLVVVQAEIHGPVGRIVLRLALDTGATATMINTALLVAAGYDPSSAPNRVQVTTGSGVEFVPRVELIRIQALGQDRHGFSVLSHTPPAQRDN